MRSYECAVIFRPTLGDENIKQGTSKFASVIDREGGEITRLETWGKRRLAYEIDDHFEGHYFFYRFRGSGALVDELGRQLRIDESVIRHMIVVDELATGQEPKVEATTLEAVPKQERETEEDSRGEAR